MGSLSSYAGLSLIVVLVGVAASVGIVAMGSAIGMPALPEPLAILDQHLPGIFRVHMFASGIALILIPWAIVLRYRPMMHRRIGRAAAALLFVGAAASLPSALQSQALPLARLGFATQGVLCLMFLIAAVRAIKMRNTQQHARLMLCVSALAFGAVVLRIMMVLAAKLEFPFDETYATAAWLSWALPLGMVWFWPTYKGRRLKFPWATQPRGSTAMTA